MDEEKSGGVHRLGETKGENRVQQRSWWESKEVKNAKAKATATGVRGCAEARVASRDRNERRGPKARSAEIKSWASGKLVSIALSLDVAATRRDAKSSSHHGRNTRIEAVPREISAIEGEEAYARARRSEEGEAAAGPGARAYTGLGAATALALHTAAMATHHANRGTRKRDRVGRKRKVKERNDAPPVAASDFALRDAWLRWPMGVRIRGSPTDGKKIGAPKSRRNALSAVGAERTKNPESPAADVIFSLDSGSKCIRGLKIFDGDTIVNCHRGTTPGQWGRARAKIRQKFAKESAEEVNMPACRECRAEGRDVCRRMGVVEILKGRVQKNRRRKSKNVNHNRSRRGVGAAFEFQSDVAGGEDDNAGACAKERKNSENPDRSRHERVWRKNLCKERIMDRRPSAEKKFKRQDGTHPLRIMAPFCTRRRNTLAQNPDRNRVNNTQNTRAAGAVFLFRIHIPLEFTLRGARSKKRPRLSESARGSARQARSPGMIASAVALAMANTRI
ncbi:hypothetical protein B0H19DRAFT_1076758 [Mycena capillaripes]|nr:hypothetical protein B0H19DRAFT_1076758 [Mycena capillaripes]